MSEKHLQDSDCCDSNPREIEKTTNIKNACNELRAALLKAGELVLHLKDHSCFKGEQIFPFQHSDMRDNIMLSYRHLEDARMRLGKVIQAYEGGVSIFDKKPDSAA